MEAIARRSLFALLFASTEDELRGILASMATDLSAGNVSGFLNPIDKNLPGRDAFRQQLVGMIQAADHNSSIQIQTTSGTAEKQVAKVDWYLDFRSKGDSMIFHQQREVLTIEFTKRGKRWSITALEPRSFFTQPKQR